MGRGLLALVQRGEVGRQGGCPRRDGVGHQPRIDHGPGGLADEVVLEKFWILVQKCFNFGKFGTETINTSGEIWRSYLTYS